MVRQSALLLAQAGVLVVLVLLGQRGLLVLVLVLLVMPALVGWPPGQLPQTLGSSLMLPWDEARGTLQKAEAGLRRRWSASGS